jgi:hypothetical protein
MLVELPRSRAGHTLRERGEWGSRAPRRVSQIDCIVVVVDRPTRLLHHEDRRYPFRSICWRIRVRPCVYGMLAIEIRYPPSMSVVTIILLKSGETKVDLGSRRLPCLSSHGSYSYLVHRSE